MSAIEVFRVQPRNAELHGIETETSNGEPAGGVHVFESLPEVQACGQWMDEPRVELATIRCEDSDVRRNGDFEGALLLAGRGEIVHRRPFAWISELAEWVARECE